MVASRLVEPGNEFAKGDDGKPHGSTAAKATADGDREAVGEGSGSSESQANDTTNAVHNNHNSVAPFRRTKTPQQPGAYHRVGGEIVPRSKALLTSSVPTSSPPDSKPSSSSPAQGRTSRRERLSERGSRRQPYNTQPSDNTKDDLENVQRGMAGAGEEEENRKNGELHDSCNADFQRRGGKKDKRDSHSMEAEKIPTSGATNAALKSLDLVDMLRTRHGDEILKTRRLTEEDGCEKEESGLESRPIALQKSEILQSKLEDVAILVEPASPAAIRVKSSQDGPSCDQLGELDQSNDSFEPCATPLGRNSIQSVSSVFDDSFLHGSHSGNGLISGERVSVDEEHGIEEGYLGHSAGSTPSENDNRLDLVEARVIIGESDQHLFDATPVDLDQRAKREVSSFFFRRKVAAAVFLISILAVIIAVVSSVGLKGSAPAPPFFFTEEPSAVPTRAPTMAPTSTIIIHLPEATKAKIALDPDGPQARAYLWLLQDPNWKLYSNERLMQRFALSVLYYSTGGNGKWSIDDSWLSYDVHECEWAYRSNGEELRPCKTLGNGYETYQNLLL
jgi:hypothetical protein